MKRTVPVFHNAHSSAILFLTIPCFFGIISMLGLMLNEDFPILRAADLRVPIYSECG